MEEKKQKMIDYLESKNLLSFATSDKNGNPFVRSVEYVNDGPDIYFLTDEKSTKVEHIKNNSNIAYTVDEDFADWSKIQGIQMRGKAVIVEGTEENEKAMAMLMAKFPQFADMPSDGINICIVKIKPTTGIFIDHLSGSGMHHEISYNENN